MFWNLTLQVILRILCLLKHTQDGAYTKYEKQFNDMAIDLRAQGNEGYFWESKIVIFSFQNLLAIYDED